MVPLPEMDIHSMMRFSFLRLAAVVVLACPCGVQAQGPDKAAVSVDALYTSARQAQARGDLNEAIRDYEKILQIAPGLAAAYNNLGSLYYDSGAYSKAAATLEEGLKKDPGMGASHAILGSTYLALGRPGDAALQFSAAVKANPADRRSADLLEQALIAKGDYVQAAARIRERLKSMPDDQAAWYRLGKVYLELSQESLSKAESIAPDSPIAHELQGEMQENLGNLAAAQRLYESAVQEAPEKPGTHEHLGNILWVQNLWPGAQKEFEAELANDGGNCRVHWKLADCMLNENQDPQAALSHLNTAIQSCPDLMQARVDRARALLAMGRAAEGLPDLLLAVKQNPEESTIHFLLAKAYQANGQVAEAKTEMELFGRLANKDKHVPQR